MRKAEAEGRIEKLRLGKKLLNNLGLKLISVVVAVALWFLVVISDDPKERRVYPNITVKLTNVELLEKENKVFEVLENTNVARVTVEVPRSDLDKLTAADIVAEADMSNLTAVNTVPIKYSVVNEDVNVINVTGSRDVVRLNVEDKVSKWVRVYPNVIGEVAEGYIVAGTDTNGNTIEVTGPESAVERIDHAEVDFEVNGATSELNASVETKLYDAEGNLLDLPNVTKNMNYVQMTVQVLATKEVPVELKVTGTPAEGYLATGVMESSPSAVLIAGTPSALADVSKITIPESQLNIAGAEGNVENIVNIKNYLPGNIQLADKDFDGRVTITAYVEPEEERTLIISGTNIIMRGLPDGFDWELDREAGPCRVRISGLNAAVSQVQQNEIYGTVDMEEWMAEEEIELMKEGIYQVPVSFNLPEDVSLEEDVYVQIIITEWEEEQE